MKNVKAAHARLCSQQTYAPIFHPTTCISYIILHKLCIMRKPGNPVYAKKKNNNGAAAQLVITFVFLYICSKSHLPIISKFSTLYQSYVTLQPSLCRPWSKTLKTVFFRDGTRHDKTRQDKTRKI